MKVRLDQALAARGLAESREKARRAIMAGQVYVDGQKADKPGTLVAEEAAIEVQGGEKYVGRGGLKLEAALDGFGISPAGQVCLDVGASTGGFTDCLLQRGAARVHAVDVGHGQLDWRLRNDPRVIVREGLNARNLAPEDIDEPVSLAVADVSFISLALILPPVFALLEPEADVVTLIKPQFELAPSQVGRGGVVRDAALREQAVEKIRALAEEKNWKWRGVMESPITGREGNVEFLAYLRNET